MARRVFYSFHYLPDAWRASQVRNMGVVEGNSPATDNDWETVKGGGDAAIQRWIDGQLSGRTCTVVLVGSATAGRKWINYEISKSWAERKGVLGIYIHNLKDASGRQCSKGANPFAVSAVGLSQIVSCYDPPGMDSVQVYNHIKANLSTWIESAVALRARYQ
jgi:hypothetical protein